MALLLVVYAEVFQCLCRVAGKLLERPMLRHPLGENTMPSTVDRGHVGANSPALWTNDCKAQMRGNDNLGSRLGLFVLLVASVLACVNIWYKLARDCVCYTELYMYSEAK